MLNVVMRFSYELLYLPMWKIVEFKSRYIYGFLFFQKNWLTKKIQSTNSTPYYYKKLFFLQNPVLQNALHV